MVCMLHVAREVWAFEGQRTRHKQVTLHVAREVWAFEDQHTRHKQVTFYKLILK